MSKARDLADIAGAIANSKIPSSKLDVSFENISDTGTEGTKVATGTTAQRGSTTGQFRFNSTIGKFEGRNSGGFVTIEPNPVVSSVNISNITQAQIDANFDLVITGENYFAGSIVKFIGNDNTEYTSPIVTVNSLTQITARVPTSIDSTKEPFKVSVISEAGNIGNLASAFNIDAAPIYTTSAGNLGTVEEGLSTNLTIAATDSEGDSVTYAEQGGTILSSNGFSLNSTTGVITGTAPTVGSNTTYSFNVRATSGTNTTDRAFNIIVGNSPTGGDFENTYTYNGVTYKIHKFTGNGNLLLNVAKTIDYLIIGGGGGGGHHSGGGGGAGGLVWLTSQSLTAGTYYVTVGAGGATGNNDSGSNGANSTFNSKIALGGGGGNGAGGSASGYKDGGSGGGGLRGGAAGQSIQNSTYGYGIGYNGATSGANNGSQNYAGYGGGGAGGNGNVRIGGVGSSTFVGDAASTTAFLLGSVAGTNSSRSATTSGSTGTLYIAGGGGGSDQSNATDSDLNGGLGGGGNGSDSSGYTGSTALANTGSGAGGQGWNGGGVPRTSGGASGIVIIRYTV